MAYRPRVKDSYIRKLEQEENEQFSFLLSQLSRAYDGDETTIKSSFNTVTKEDGTVDINVTFTVNQASAKYLELSHWLHRQFKKDKAKNFSPY